MLLSPHHSPQANLQAFAPAAAAGGGGGGDADLQCAFYNKSPAALSYTIHRFAMTRKRSMKHSK